MKTADSAAYYHVCTDGNALDWMFWDRSDFIAGVNRIGICALETGILVFAFVLMDNHVHFVLCGDISDVECFFDYFCQLYALKKIIYQKVSKNTCCLYCAACVIAGSGPDCAAIP